TEVSLRETWILKTLLLKCPTFQVTVPDSEPMMLCGGRSPVCGKPTRIIADYERILGGREAPAGAVPWQVLLNIEGVRVGGVVVAERWILTAAHDLKHSRKSMSSEAVQVRPGVDLHAVPSPILAASVHIHPEYNNSDGLDRDNDIALIRLQQPLTFNAAIMPICLTSGVCVWYDQILLLVHLHDVNPPLLLADFQSSKRRHNLPRLTDNMFCVGLPEGGQSSCLGDNGGPFALSDDGQFWAAGIDSWGVDCGKQGTYRVYTKVANYLDWINQTIHDNGETLRYFHLTRMRVWRRYRIELKRSERAH
uniref:trypsin n=1 Tax=Takifugu rubripes TaxID=31033 RepID=A0A674PD90_TAKRU